MKSKDNIYFSNAIIKWQKKHGRHHLPWQKNRTAYRVWLSEIMLQQTQVSTVLPYFERFMNRFHDVYSLSSAHIDEVLFLWSGLGYYSRARNLHRTARMVVKAFDGKFPNNINELQKLPGIGRSTAGAIMVFAHNQHAAILDGNVKRILARYFAVSEPINLSSTQKQLWAISERCVPKDNITPYTQGMMDLGAMTCTRTNPKCDQCPLQSECLSFAQNIQNTLPNKQKTKAKPTRQSDFILISDEQRVLLKKRPNRGVWGGLWCLPLAEDFHGLTPQPIVAMGPEWLELRHTFSHFHLDCHIYQATFNQLYPLTGEWIWYNYYYPITIGLAAPMKKIIHQWFEAQAYSAQQKIAEPFSKYNNQ